ncbi:MAG: NAD-dependent epimerase/dehydratase family protein [Candidatus Omnitrophica bacterium]|nr:NAD-dependent epimerase/dehydratase family protein [Candidatus Omnitrophota bacterium]
MSSFWKDKKILVTGGDGFIGAHVIKNLVQKRGVAKENIVVPRHEDYDLRNLDHARRAVSECDYVIHLAAQTGGIAYSRAYPATQYQICSMIDLNVLEAARAAGVRKVISIGNILVYPKDSPLPFHEEGVFDGKIADTHLGIGLAKRNMLYLAEMYSKEFGMDVVTVISANAYGPGDRFDPQISHVIPATIIKCSQLSEIVVWGDGSPTRDFLYVEDIAEGLLLAGEKLEGCQFVNIGSEKEVSIRDLVHLIAKLMDYKGVISFDSTKGGGDPRRVACTDKAKTLLGFRPEVDLESGLKRTIEWYRSWVAQKT